MIPAIATMFAAYVVWRLVDRLTEGRDGAISPAATAVGWLTVIVCVGAAAYVWGEAGRVNAQIEDAQRQVNQILGAP